MKNCIYLLIFVFFVPDFVLADIELLDGVRNKDFSSIENVINLHELNLLNNPVNEERLVILYNQLARGVSESDLKHLNDWIKNDNTNHVPYLLKGMYLNDLGWRHRGRKYIKYTPKENLQKMHSTFSLAEKDLLVAIKINPRAITAYIDLIGIYFAIGEGSTKGKEIYNKGISENPNSVEIRNKYLNFLLPKWGMSYELRRQYVEELELQSKTNSDMRLVLSHNYAQLADQASDYKSSIKLFNKALSYGYTCRIHKNKAYMLFKYKHYEHSLSELNDLIKKCPDYASAYLIKGRTLDKLGDEQGAMLNLDKAFSLSPGDPQILGTRGFIHLRKKRYRQAIDDLTKALDKNQMTAWMWDNRGHAYHKLKMYEKAVSDFTAALKVDPTYTRAYRRRGNSYKKIKKYDLALKDYTEGLLVSPDNISLLLRRAKLKYYIFSDLKSAVSDLEHAININPKHKKALKLYNKIK